MHLWPSLKLRSSFKSTSQKRYQRTSSGKQSQSNQEKLLSSDKESGPEISSGWLLSAEILPWFSLAASAVSAAELALMRKRIDASYPPEK